MKKHVSSKCHKFLFGKKNRTDEKINQIFFNEKKKKLKTINIISGIYSVVVVVDTHKNVNFVGENFE